MAKIRVFLTDDHTLFRQGIRTLLSAEPDIEIIGEAPNAGETVERATDLRPDVVLLDISMPGMSSFQAIRQLHKVRPDTKVLLLTMYDDEDYLAEGMDAGSDGVNPRLQAVQRIFGAIIALVGCHFGMITKGGTVGVGNSTTRSVVTISIAILIADFFLT